jgi:hypothetical protein
MDALLLHYRVIFFFSSSLERKNKLSAGKFSIKKLFSRTRRRRRSFSSLFLNEITITIMSALLANQPIYTLLDKTLLSSPSSRETQ